jgi:hypothetical protein
MKFIYAPEGQEPQTFQIDDIYDLEGPECELIEEAGGTQWDTFGGWYDLLGREGYRAAKAFTWVMLRRANPELGFEELVRFKMSDATFVAADDEVEEGKDESGEAASVPADEATSSASLTPDSAV